MKNHWILVLSVSLAVGAQAAPINDKIDAFNSALKAGKEAVNPVLAGRLIPSIDVDTYPGGDANLEMTVRQMMASDPSPDVQKAGEALLEEIKAERKDRLDQEKAKLDAVLTRVPATVATAQKPADLDALLGDIQAAIPDGSNGFADPEFQAESNRANSVYQFVAQWQDYLSQRSSGNLQDALNTLRNLENVRPPGDILVPRSQILSQITDLEKQTRTNPVQTPLGPPRFDIGPVLDAIQTPDDLEAAVRKLPPQQNYMQTPDMQEVEQLASLYAQARNGLPVSLELTPSNIGLNIQQLDPGFARVEAMLVLYLLPRFLGSDAPAPNPNESVDAYLDRAIAASETSSNWPLLERVLDAKVKIGGGRITPPGLQSFLAGINQEMAAQYDLAVASYESALGSPDDLLPTKVIGDRLAAIKKDHPDDYAAGMKNFTNPPMRPFQLNPYFVNPAFRIGLPGYPAGYPAGMNPGLSTGTTPVGAPAPAPAGTSTLPSTKTTSAPATK